MILSYDGKELEGIRDKSVVHITIPNGVYTIGFRAFFRCLSLQSVFIPNSVTSIGESAFSGCTSLKNIDIPDTVKKIGSGAFYGCSLLKDVKILNSVTEIANWTFQNCTSLKSIDIPNSLNKIGAWAFKNCISLQDIRIPKTVVEIGSDAFENTKWYEQQPDGIIYINSILYKFKGDVNKNPLVIKQGTTVINNNSFKGCASLESIDIPDSVTEIGYGAFSGCTSLKSVDIPNSIRSIALSAFKGCTSLESIGIPDSVTEIGNDAFDDTKWYEKQPDGVIYINSILYNFKGDVNKNPLVIKQGTTVINAYAFKGCTSLESIDIPNSVTVINAYAFEGCTSLESIDIPNSVTEIGSGAFKGCTSLESIDIPDSVTEIGGGAFKGCISLESIDIPDSVTEIGGGAFEGCTSLESIDIPDSVTEIGRFAFNRSSLKEFNITANIIEIGEHAICNCPLCSITVDKDNPVYFAKDDVLYKKWDGDKSCLVKYAPQKADKRFCLEEKTVMLDSCAFKKAKELVEIVLHEGVLSLGEEQTFAYCTSLKQIHIPSNVKKIPKYAFSGCSSLNNIILPNSNSYSLEESVFKQCVSLHSIHSLAENIDNIVIDEKAFDGFDIDKCVLYVPSGTRWAYRHHSGFGKFKNIETEKKREQGSQGDLKISKLFNERPMEDILITKLRANVERYSKIKEGITKTLYLEDGEDVVFDIFDWSKGTENAFIYLNDGKRKIWYSFLRQMYFTKEMEIVYPTIRFYGDSTDTTINTFTGKEFETAVNKRTFKVEIDKRAIYTFNRKCPKFIDMEYNQDRAYQYIMQLLNEKNINRLGSLLKMGQCYHFCELSSV